MRYRTLDVRIWCDQKFRALSPILPSGQALFIYLLTNPNTNIIPGLYRAGAAAMAEELGWTLEDFRKAFQEIMDHGLVKADLKARVIFIPNAIKYNKPQSPNVVISWKASWDEIPECDLKNAVYREIKAFIEGMGKAFMEAFDKAISEVMPDQEQEQGQEQKINSICEAKASPASIGEKDLANIEIQEIFKYWQQILNHPHAKLDGKRASKIKQAFKLGFSIQDLKKAIDGCALSPFNMGLNNLKRVYDDINLILRDASHIEQFISAASNPSSAANKVNNDIFAGAL